jgi:chromosomal replication initiator protein
MIYFFPFIVCGKFCIFIGGSFMSYQIADIWHKTLDLLKTELTEISFNTWIKTIEPVSIDSNSINLGVPAEFNKGILESRYSILIQNALKQVTYKEYRINFVIPSQENTKKTVHVDNGSDEQLVSV